MQARETLIDITKLLLKSKKLILRNLIIAGILAIIIVLFMPNYFKATTTFYPASPDIMKPEHIFGTATKDMEYYGTGVDLDRMLTVAQSNELYDFMIDSFDLYKRYDIDSSGSKARYKAHMSFREHYNIEKTKLEAIELSIEDTDPAIAASMANATRFRINNLVSNLLKSNLNELAVTIMDNIRQKQTEVNILADSVKLLRNKYKIIDSESQAIELMKKMVGTESKLKRDEERLKVLESVPGIRKDTIYMLKAMVAGLRSEYKSITDTNSTSAINFTNFNAGRNTIDIMSTQLRSAKDYLTVYNTRYNQIIGVLKGNNNALHLVEAADIPLVKSRPRRSLIVLSVILATLLFNVIGIIVINTLKDPEWKKLWNE